MKICKEMLENYRQTELNLLVDSSSQQPIHLNSPKTYPLPFNAYNLDEDKKVKISKLKSKI